MKNTDQRYESKELLPEELRDTEEEIIREAQEAFHEEYKLVKKQRPVSPRSTLTKLNPIIDKQGVIRSNSRLRGTEYLPYYVRFPVILPRGY